MKLDRNIIRKMIVEELLTEKVSGSALKTDPEHIFQNVIRVGTKIYYGLDAVYQVTKLYPGGFSVQMRSAGRSGGMFARKFNMEKDNFISQAKMGLIKKVD